MNEREKTKFGAIAICVVMVTGHFGIWTLIEGGGIERLTYGQLPASSRFEPQLISHKGEPRDLRPLVALVLFLPLPFDIRALCYRNPNYTGRVPQPADDPDEYINFRLRRFVLILVVLGWLMLFCRVLVLPATPVSAVGFFVAFYLSRRGESSTYGTILGTWTRGAGEFCDKFSGR